MQIIKLSQRGHSEPFKDQICILIKGFGIFGDSWQPDMDVILGVASWLDLVVAYTIFMDKKLSAHPAYLVGFIALSDGFFSYLGLTRNNLCYYDNFINLFSQTVLFSNQPLSKERSFYILAGSYLFLMTYTLLLITLLSIFMSIDLVLTMRNPFKNPSVRAYWYYSISVTYALIGTLLIANVDYLPTASVTIYVTLSTKFIFFATVIPSLMFTFLRLRQPGLSKQYRKLLIKRHVTYVLLTVFCQLTGTLSYLQTIKWINMSEFLQKACAYYFSVVAIFLALIRMTEPSVSCSLKSQLKNGLKKLTCHYQGTTESEPTAFDRPDLIEENDLIDGNLNSFLTSSLNVELVYTILKGISHFVSIPQLKDWMDGDQSFTKFDDSSIKIAKMQNIRIFNYKVWENAHQQLFVNCPNVPFSTNLDGQLKGSVAQEDFINLNKKVDVEGYFIYNFAALREADGISTESVLASLDAEMNRSRVFKAGEASGASGSFFFFSHDNKFIIKTISVEEKKFFTKKVAPEYFKYLQENPRSLIARIYGLYQVEMEGVKAVNLMLMAHTLKVKSSDRIQRVFDLKGSWESRRVKIQSNTSSTRTLKDVNFVELQQRNVVRINLGRSQRVSLLNQLTNDTKFLSSLNIMDYSLLLAVESKFGNQLEQRDRSVILSLDGLERHIFDSEDQPVVYHMGLIDYLQEWNVGKKLERATKIIGLGRDPGGLSCIEPITYQNRFMAFLKKQIL